MPVSFVAAFTIAIPIAFAVAIAAAFVVALAVVIVAVVIIARGRWPDRPQCTSDLSKVQIKNNKKPHSTTGFQCLSLLLTIPGIDCPRRLAVVMREGV